MSFNPRFQSQPMQSHNSTGLGFGLLEVWHHCGQVRSAVWDPLGAPGGLVAFDVLVALVDARKRGHVEDVSDAVLRLQGWTLDIGSTDLLGHVGALRENNTSRSVLLVFIAVEVYRYHIKAYSRPIIQITYVHIIIVSVKVRAKCMYHLPDHMTRVSVCDWTVPPVWWGLCGGLTCIPPAESWCWDKTPGSLLATIEKTIQKIENH